MKPIVDRLIDEIIVYIPLSLVKRRLTPGEKQATKTRWEKKGLIKELMKETSDE